VVRARAFGHTGPGQEPAFVIPAMAQQIVAAEAGRGEPVIRVGNLDVVRDLGDVRDVVRAYAALIERGRAGSGLFVLEDGQALVEAPEGTRQLGPGDVFGERSLFGEDGERTARVRAQTNVRCLAIARTELEQVIAEHPSFGERLRSLAG
jgi:CRP-like cAMP-binding protein